MINLPKQTNQTVGTWYQANNSDLYGNVHVTKNITFDIDGYLTLSNSPRAAINESDSDFDNPAVILFSADFGYYVQTWDQPFEVNTQVFSIRPTVVSVTGTEPVGAAQSDAIFFSGLMPVTEADNVRYYDPAANSFTDTNITLTGTTGGQHPLENFVSLSSFCVANLNTVLRYTTLTATPTLAATLTINSDFYITSLAYFNQNLYIGTRNMYGGHAFLYVWNGQGTAAQQSYEVDSPIIYDVCMHQDSIVLVTGNGSLLQFNGTGFTLLDAFPIFYTDMALPDEANLSMYHNMLKSNGNLLYINFSNTENESNALLNQPDGIWCYDSRLGFMYHRYSLSNSLVEIDTNIPTTDVNTTTNEITISSAIPVTGTECVYNSGGGTAIGGLVSGQKYFVIKVSNTRIKLALTKADALAGTAIDLTGTGNNAQDITSFPNIDYGQFYVNKTFALNVIDRPVTNRIYGTDLLWGGEVYRRDSTASYGTLGSVSNNVEARGYYITPKLFSQEVTDNFNKVVLKWSKLRSELDKIIIKYRTETDNRDIINISGTRWNITWTSTSTFTTTQTDWSEALIGDEIEILRGAAGGLLAHITAISEAGGTYTVTIDETYPNYLSGDIGKAVFRNWKKWETIEYGDSNAEQGFLDKQLGVVGKFIQFKIELRGIGTRLEEFIVDNITRLPVKD